MLSDFHICLELKQEIETMEGEGCLLVAAEKGELGILRTADFDIHVVVLNATDAEAEVELIGLSHTSVVYDGKIFRLSVGEKHAYTFRANRNPILVELSYR